MNFKILLSATIILFIFCSITFRDVIAGNNVFSTPDQLSAAAIGKGMESFKEETGEYPKWNPWVFSGLPSTHSMQHVSRYYPPNIIIKFFHSVGLPWFWNYLFHYLFAGLGCFVLLISLGTRFWSAIFGAIGFMLTPYMVTMIVHGHGSQMMTSAYIPWVFWCLNKCINQPILKNVGILALILGLQLLRGHVQIAYYTWLIVGCYLLLYVIKLILSQNYILIKRIFYIIAAMFISLLTSMILYFPVKSYTKFSIRGGSEEGGTGFEYATQWSFSFGEILTFFNPSFFGFGGTSYWGNMPFTDYPNYMGILLLTLAIYTIYRISGFVKLVLLISAVSALLLSFGNNLFLYELFYYYFPFFNKFRVPAMFLIIVQFSVAILGGLGLNAVLNLDNYNKLKYFFVFIGSIVGILIFSGLAAKGLHEKSIKYIPQMTSIRLDMIYDDLFSSLIILIISAGLIYYFKKNNFNFPIAEIGCVFLLGIDLGMINERIIYPENRNIMMKVSKFNQEYYQDDIIQFLKKDKSDFRILPLGPLMNDNRWSAFKIKNAAGYHPAKLANYQQMMSEVGFNSFGFLQMMNIKYLITLEPFNSPLFPLVYTGNIKFQGKNLKAYIFENKLQNKSIFIPQKIIYEKNQNDVILNLKNPSYSPQDSVYISQNNYPQNINLVDKGYVLQKGTVIEYNNLPDIINCKVSMDSPGLVVFSEIYYPNGWIAEVDGIPTQIIKVNNLLRAVYLEKGDRSIKMIFDPNDLKIGKYLTSFGWLLIFGFIGFGLIINKLSLKN